MDISSIALTSLFASSPVEPVVVDPVADVVGVDVGSVVAIGAVGAKDAAKVEGTIVVNVGMKVAGALSSYPVLSPSPSTDHSVATLGPSSLHDCFDFRGPPLSVGAVNEETYVVF